MSYVQIYQIIYYNIVYRKGAEEGCVLAGVTPLDSAPMDLCGVAEYHKILYYLICYQTCFFQSTLSNPCNQFLDNRLFGGIESQDIDGLSAERLVLRRIGEEAEADL